MTTQGSDRVTGNVAGSPPSGSSSFHIMKLPPYVDNRQRLWPVGEELYFALQLIYPYLQTRDIFASSLVSQRFNAIFHPLLWYDPIWHLWSATSSISDGERRYAQFTNSVVTLRQRTANMIKILDFSGSPSGLFPTDEVRLEKLKDLKVLIFNQQNLNNVNENYQMVALSLLYVLVAHQLSDVRLVQDTFHKSRNTILFIDLSYLDCPCSDMTRLFTEKLPCLAILKLRGHKQGLTVKLLETILEVCRSPLFSLDISYNPSLDDRILTILEREGFLPHAFAPADDEVLETNPFPGYWDNPPPFSKHDHGDFDSGVISGVLAEDVAGLELQRQERVTYRQDELYGVLHGLRKAGCLGHSHRDAPRTLAQVQGDGFMTENHNAKNTLFSASTGITHWSVGGTSITAEILMNKLSNRGIQHLDLGTIGDRKSITRTWGSHKWVEQHSAATFITHLTMKHFNRLHHLRIHHGFITTLPITTPTNNGFTPTNKGFTPTTKQLTRLVETHADPAKLATDSFNPNNLPSLHTLVLVQFPRLTTGIVLDRLKALLQQAAAQEDVVARAGAGSTSRWGPRVFKGLRVLLLELVPKPSTDGVSGFDDEAGDVESLNQAAAGDFSFFGTPHGTDVRGAGVLETREVAGAPVVDVCEALRQWRKGDERQWTGKIIVRG